MLPILIALVFIAFGLGVIARRRWWRVTYDAAAQSALDEWDVLTREFIGQSELAQWTGAHSRVVIACANAWLLPTPALHRLHHLGRDLEQARGAANGAFSVRRLSDDETWMDSLLASPLAECQRLAIVNNDNNLLVLAGAGSGKTATLTAKIAYVVRHQLAHPDAILAIAFNRKAQAELAQRIPDVVNQPVTASTFHALGRQILYETSDAPIRISPWVDQPEARLDFVRQRFAERLLDQDLSRPVRELLTTALADLAGEPPASIADAVKKARAFGLRSLGGVRHKSLAEVAIANWLTLNGIAWEYEPSYPTPSGERWVYRPDFQVAGLPIYIEHFGLDRDGNAAPWIDGGKYKRSIEWKRAIHRAGGTTLIETFQYDFSERCLLAKLEDSLKDRGVLPRQLADQEVLQLLKAEGTEAAHLLKFFDRAISLIRGNFLERKPLYDRCITERDRLFLDLALWVVDEYERHLADRGEIDFDDMIIRAAACVRERRWLSPWKYLLVDEFQDISGTRLGLVEALRDQQPHSRVFVVGDDWQSIYSFAGSNIGILRELEAHLGYTAQSVLDITYRFGQGLVEVTSAFVQANPAQLKRSISSKVASGTEPCVSVRLHDPEFESREMQTVLEEIAADARGTPATVFVLGRYQHRVPDDFHELQRTWEGRRLTLLYSTVHSGKGLEADYVIVVGVDEGRLGFPSQVEDDPALALLIPDRDPFPHAEERRVFYVALTRARRRVYVLGSASAPSTFLSELSAYPGELVSQVQTGVEAGYCVACKCRSIVRRTGPHGDFWGCRNYPICPEKPPECPSCHQRPLEFDEAARQWACRACHHEERACPRCRTGVLMKKTGRYGDFKGCSNWRPHDGCDFTARI